MAAHHMYMAWIANDDLDVIHEEGVPDNDSLTELGASTTSLVCKPLKTFYYFHHLKQKKKCQQVCLYDAQNSHLNFISSNLFGICVLMTWCFWIFLKSTWIPSPVKHVSDCSKTYFWSFFIHMLSFLPTPFLRSMLRTKQAPDQILKIKY